MKKEGKSKRFKQVILTIGAFLIVIFVLLPISLAIFDGSKYGNVALIPIEGIITGNGGKYLGQSTISSKDIVGFIEEAEENSGVKVILLEINSPGGSPVASDEIAAAVKKAEKPVISLIKETGASGGYWVASATDWIIANKMSITGSIGVTSSYLEFSGLMEEYGVGYEKLAVGKYKELGNPFQKLSLDERNVLQKKINKIHHFFIEEVAVNRDLKPADVEKLATGEFYLGVEALDYGLIDSLGNKDTAEEHLKNTYNLDAVDYVVYKKQVGFFDLFSSVMTDFSFAIGEGFGSVMLRNGHGLMLI